MTLQDYISTVRARLEKATRDIPEVNPKLNSINFGGRTSAWLKAEKLRYVELGIQMQMCRTELPTDLSTLLAIVEIQAKALEYYSEHESVLKEAYHSNHDGQITCVHTFINHTAKECQAAVAEILE